MSVGRGRGEWSQEKTLSETRGRAPRHGAGCPSSPLELLDDENAGVDAGVDQLGSRPLLVITSFLDIGGVVLVIFLPKTFMSVLIGAL